MEKDRNPAWADGGRGWRGWAALARYWMWDRDLDFRFTSGRTQVTAFLACLAGLAGWIYFHSDFAQVEQTGQVMPFYNGARAEIGTLDASLASVVLWAFALRVIFGLCVGFVDLAFHQRLTGKPFDWASMVNLSAVNALFLFTLPAAFVESVWGGVIDVYRQILVHVPTLFHLHGAWALLLAALLGDLIFYGSHRLSHKNRLLWNLGHVNHHRNQNLNQLNHAIDALFLNVPLGTVIVLISLPVLSKLFAFSVADAGWWLIVAMALDAWTDPSHSPALYRLESRWAVLRWFRWFLVTPAVHYTHHSREERHNLSDGCNFAARFTVWDRLFGTYTEPPRELPDVGLFGATTDYCKTPLRFVLKPYVRMYIELRRNSWRCWHKILFGPTSYEPPHRSGMGF